MEGDKSFVGHRCLSKESRGEREREREIQIFTILCGAVGKEKKFFVRKWVGPLTKTMFARTGKETAAFNRAQLYGMQITTTKYCS